MTLSDLTEYALTKHHITQQFRWTELPGFSVMVHPQTGKWVALLMRQWDSESGEQIERCDLKCGRTVGRPYLALPFRMRGPDWTGVRILPDTPTDEVLALFDKACSGETEKAATIVLKAQEAPRKNGYKDTPLPPSSKALPIRTQPAVPEMLHRMNRLYAYGDGSFGQRCKNFYIQGKFMENYRDDQEWQGSFERYFPTYHDLNLRQLRGYFTWRTKVREENYEPANRVFVNIYLFELLNGIGTSSVTDSLMHMKRFADAYFSKFPEDEETRSNLSRWMPELAILHRLPPETVEAYMPREQLKRDRAMTVLRTPQEHGDEEVFQALFDIAGERKLPQLCLKTHPERTKHIFAQAWRCANLQVPGGETLFEHCFGTPGEYPWRPLANTVFYWPAQKIMEGEYTLNACRTYGLKNNHFTVKTYGTYSFVRWLFEHFLRECDRQCRTALGAGHPLRPDEKVAWVRSYVEEAVREDARREMEKRMPKVEIDFSSLERIRRDALATEESLMTESETGDEAERELSGARPDEPPDGPCDLPPAPETVTANAAPALSLDPLQRRILVLLLRGESVDGLMRAERLIPSVFADAVNEALMDEFGDTVLECENDKLTMTEDYRADLGRLLGEMQ